MDDVFEAVNGGDFGIAAFVGAAGYGDFVVFADGHRANLGWKDNQRLGTGRNMFRRPTLYLSRSSLLRGALIMTRRTPDGAVKWALRDFLREEWRAFEDGVSNVPKA